MLASSPRLCEMVLKCFQNITFRASTSVQVNVKICNQRSDEMLENAGKELESVIGYFSLGIFLQCIYKNKMMQLFFSPPLNAEFPPCIITEKVVQTVPWSMCSYLPSLSTDFLTLLVSISQQYKDCWGASSKSLMLTNSWFRKQR